MELEEKFDIHDDKLEHDYGGVEEGGVGREKTTQCNYIRNTTLQLLRTSTCISFRSVANIGQKRSRVRTPRSKLAPSSFAFVTKLCCR
jgi:hypothetical protein